LELYHRIVESQLSVRQVEELARTSAPKGAKSANATARPNKELSRQLAERFGSKVSVKQTTEGKGKIEIAFKNEEELQRILGRMS
jgi:ParB family transcriptional regulator, chromosome partitioning protein